METERTAGGWQANPAQYAAAVAAEKARQAGADPIAAARAALVDADAVLVRRYLLAIARAMHGNFENLTGADLYDVAALTTLELQTFDDWRAVRDGVRD